ncbi:MAG: hypothetical protein SFY56_11855 [Bacteroidota bacterium]|nr:hypothetical protein [Bacteroidota bacterium]
MKNLKLIITTVAVFVSLNLVCSNNNTINSANIQKEIQAQFNLKAEVSEKVEVVFTTNEQGNVNLAIVKTQNQNLKKAIETNFLKLHLSNVKANNVYSVVINVKLV